MIRMLNIHSVCELLSSVWAYQTWWEWWIHIQRVSLLSNVCADQNHHWWECLDMYPGCESLTSVWEDQNQWWEWLNIYLGCESLLRRSELLTRKTEYTSSKWVHSNACTGQNHWPEWLNIIHWQIVSLSLQCLSSRTTDKNKHTVCESLSAWSVWADQYHLQEWLDMHPACEFTF